MYPPIKRYIVHSSMLFRMVGKGMKSNGTRDKQHHTSVSDGHLISQVTEEMRPVR
jgi:hypothetical protein